MIKPDPFRPPGRPCRSSLHEGLACRHGWLIEFGGRRVDAMHPWPDLRAWCRPRKGAKWRPAFQRLHVYRHQGVWQGELSDRQRGVHRPNLDHQPIHSRMEENPVMPQYVLSRQEAAEPNLQQSARGDYNDPHDDLGSEARRARHRETNRKAIAKYLQQIPEEVLSAVAAFPDNHWNLLGLAAFGGEAMKLIEVTPGLAVALSSPWDFRDISPEQAPDSIREMLGKRQIQIAEWLGFPGVGRSVEVIRKLPPEECTVDNLRTLRTHMEAAVRLHQVPRFNTTLLDTLTCEGKQVRLMEDFLAELGALPRGASDLQQDADASILKDVQWMRRHLGDRGVIALRSREQLRKLHDSLLERMGRSDMRILNRPPLPTPPLDPHCTFLDIEPVTTEAEVLEEASLLAGDLGGYLPRLLKGELYLYRVRTPEDIIFTVHLWRGARWRLQEIQRRDGRQIGRETLDAVFDWLDMAEP